VIRRQRGIVPGTHCRGDGATRRKRDENGTRVTKAKHGYVYVCACMRRACRRAVAEVPRGLEAQFCSVNPWRRARGVYHPASEFVVPRLVTSASVFRASVLFISHPPSTPPPRRRHRLPSRAAIYLHNREDVHAPPRIQGRVPETPRDQNRSRRIPRRSRRSLLKANPCYARSSIGGRIKNTDFPRGRTLRSNALYN